MEERRNEQAKQIGDRSSAKHAKVKHAPAICQRNLFFLGRWGGEDYFISFGFLFLLVIQFTIGYLTIYVVRNSANNCDPWVIFKQHFTVLYSKNKIYKMNRQQKLTE